jgi:hypothetical protein
MKNIKNLEPTLMDKDCEGCKKTRAAAIKYTIIGSLVIASSIYGIVTLFNKILDIFIK